MKLASFIKFFRKQRPPKIRQANAILYPDKIIIETVDQIKDSYSVITHKLTILNINADDSQIALTMREHLGLSSIRSNAPKDNDKNFAAYLKKAGFKTRKAYYQDALLLSVLQDDRNIKLIANINGGSTGKNRGFTNSNTEPIVIDSNVSDEVLAQNIRLGWSLCKIVF
jgi:hypothetical protein